VTQKPTTRRDLLTRGARLAFVTTAGGLLADRAEAAAPGASSPAPAQQRKRRILVWSEGTAPKDVYPNDINGAVAEALKGLPGDYEVRTASINDLEQGVSQDALDQIHVLFWWGHVRHGAIPRETVERIVRRVKEGGMGFISLTRRTTPGRSRPSWVRLVRGSLMRTTASRTASPLRMHVIPSRAACARSPFRARSVMKSRSSARPRSRAARRHSRGQRQSRAAGVGLDRRPGPRSVSALRPRNLPRLLPARGAPRSAQQRALGRKRRGRHLGDNDPAAKAARATGEPPLALILRDAGYGGTDVIENGEVNAQTLVKADPKRPVTFRPLAAFGVPNDARPVGTAKRGAATIKRSGAPFCGASTKNTTSRWLHRSCRAAEPPLTPARPRSACGSPPKGSRRGHLFRRRAAITHQAFPREQPPQGPRVRGGQVDGTPVPSALIIGFEYSTNDDNQEIVALVENVRPAQTGP
jgi:hypothetical protein